MKLETAVIDGVTVLKLSGEVIETKDQQELRKAMGEALSRCDERLVVDLTDVTYLGTGAIATLVVAYVRLSKLGGQLKVCGPNDRARHVLEVTRLNTLFEVHDTLEQAIASFSTD